MGLVRYKKKTDCCQKSLLAIAAKSPRVLVTSLGPSEQDRSRSETRGSRIEVTKERVGRSRDPFFVSAKNLSLEISVEGCS